MKTYSSYFGTATIPGDLQRHFNNSASDNLTWGIEMINDSIRYLVTKYYFNERTYIVPGGTVANTQFYNLPGQIKKMINITVLIGNVLWQPQECPSAQYWDALNVITFQQDFPSWFFIFNNQVGLWPIPSSSGNVITLRYKVRTVDLSMPDVTDVTSAQTMSVTANSLTITASGSVFLNWMAGQWIRIPYTTNNATSGDNQWYQIDTVTSATVAKLKNQYTGSTIAGAPFTIGQVSILPEDYQDLPLFRTMVEYYTVRFPDPVRAQQYQAMWDAGEERLNEEFGSKTSSVVVADTSQSVVNPNLFSRPASQV